MADRRYLPGIEEFEFTLTDIMRQKAASFASRGGTQTVLRVLEQSLRSHRHLHYDFRVVPARLLHAIPLAEKMPQELPGRQFLWLWAAGVIVHGSFS